MIRLLRLTSTNNFSNRTLSNVEISDSDGIDTATGMGPRIYFKRSGDENTSEGWKFSQANNNTSPFEFTIDHTLLTGLAFGDSIQYFIVAQDIQAQPSVSINSGEFASPPINVSLTSSAFPIGGVINSYKINDVPAISYSALTSANNFSNRTLSNVEISDSDGIDTATGMGPRIYFKRSSDENTSEGWKFSQANNNTSPFEFTIDHTLLAGLAFGDSIQYFIVAQDIQAQPSVSINSGEFASPPINVSLTSAAFPIGGVINSYKINDVPAISYSALTSTNNFSNRTLSNVEISDSDGIDTATGMSPRIYFKRSGDENTSEGWKFSQANNNSSPFEFTIDHTLLTGLAFGDSIQYFIVAQDIQAQPSVSINLGEFASPPINVSLTSAAFPIGGVINSYKINDVPAISYSALTSTNNFSNRTLSNVEISDSDGIDTATGMGPRIYFKRSGDENTSEGWKFSQANNNTSPFEFTIDHTLLTGLAFGDSIQYFIVAQDIQAQPSVSINSGEFASPPINVSLTSAAFPIGGVINSYEISGLCDIGIENEIYPDGIISICNSEKILPTAVIKNYGSLNQIIPFDIIYSITGLINYTSVKQDTLSSGSTKTIYFDTVLINEPGIYFVKVYTSLQSDQNPVNDTLSSSFPVLNRNYGGGQLLNSNYYFANSTSCSSPAPSKPEFCWKDTSGSKSLIINSEDKSDGLLAGNIDNGFFSLGNILPPGHKIKFFDSEYDSVFISTNGMIGFIKNDLLFSTDPSLVNNIFLQPFPVFAPLWIDMDFENILVSGARLSYKVSGNQLILTYDKAPLKSGGEMDYISFQVCIEFGTSLIVNSRFLVQYNENSSGVNFNENYRNNSLPSHLVGLKSIDPDNYLIYRSKDSAGVSIDGPIFNSSLAVEFGTDNTNLNSKCSQLDIKVLLEAVYPLSDTISVLLRDTRAPYDILETKKILIDTSGAGSSVFTIPVEHHRYYLVIKHRNSIETWSKANGELFSSNLLNYDFSTDQSKAFGGNMLSRNGRAYIYTGDVNQDNVVDGDDNIEVYNKSNNFLTGYVPEDVNEDRVVDLDDLIFTYNNVLNFVIINKP
ncbi:MAG: hypothetical protein IPL53_15745 [Ignavibacteria bacterium]|nr:hypothetical protein [Ignavibacteria bacterium]